MGAPWAMGATGVMGAPWAWGVPLAMGAPRAIGAPLAWEAMEATGAHLGMAVSEVMEMIWAMGAPWAVGVNMGPVALAVLGGPTALASPPVAWDITSLVPRGGAGPAAGAVGLSKAPRMAPRTSNSPEARTMA